MLTAKIGEEIINCFDGKYDRYRLKQWSSKGIIKCPVCSGDYEYCHGEVVSPYFRHVGKDCDGYYSEPETDEHRNGKLLLYNWIRNQHGVTNCKLESWIPETKQRPDIYFEYNGKRFVIEYQCSPIASEFLVRKELYKLAGINDIWILGTEKYNININTSGNPMHNGRYKTIEKNDFVYFNVNTSSFYINNKLIKGNLKHKALILNDFYRFDINQMEFINEISVKENYLQPFIDNDIEEYKMLKKVRKFKNKLNSNLQTIVSDLNTYFKEDYFYYNQYSSIYYLGKITYGNFAFFIHRDTLDICKEYLKSVPFRGKRGGLGWEKKTFYDQIQTVDIDLLDTNSIFYPIKQFISDIKNKKEIKYREKQKKINEKYYPIFGEFLNKEIILIHQGKDNVPNNLRFKFLKGFNIFDNYMTINFLNELKFLEQKNIDKFIFMIPKYHSHFNNMGFSNYVRVGEFKDIIKSHFESYGFSNVKFINEMEDIN
ncbi:competence protein CoiA family protein [Heyndrickxia oleronia]|uniref:competence protein CoiA n=1 Tax=Heyndrickxia oleronia TaxID=38875 RepID=UPI003F247FF5